MTSLFLTVGIAMGMVGLTMAAMSVGVVFKGRCLRGSCGGIAGDNCLCKLRRRGPRLGTSPAPTKTRI